MKRLVVSLLLTLLVALGAVSASTAGSRVPLELGSTFEGAGGSWRGAFLPDTHFDVGVLIRNTSGVRLVLTDARVVASRHSLAHQIGARFHRWNPPHCPPDVAGCLVRPFPMTRRAKQAKPFVLSPGKQAGVELDFQLDSCAEIQSATVAPLSRLLVTFRRPTGSVGHYAVPLGRATLRFRRPNAADCRDPHSSLTVAGPRRYASGDTRAIAGSTGDVCTIRNGRLYFASRQYRTSGQSRFERITLQVGDYVLGKTGTFRKTTLKLVADRRTVFRTHPTVRVTTGTNRVVLATFRASRPPFLVSGALRCRVVR